MSFFGSTQNKRTRRAVPEELAHRARRLLRILGGAMRTAKSMPKPTWPLLGSHDLSVTSFGMRPWP